MDWYILLGLVGAGFLAGFINILAGSGSLLTLPFLMFLGLPANIANGTNRIAILLQNIVAVSSFEKQKVLHFRKGLWLSLPAIIGAIIGAQIAVYINEYVMRLTIGGLLMVMFCLIIFKPSVWLKGKTGEIKAKPTIFQVIIFFAIGLYGGFIQAGVGLFLLAGLVLGAGLDLVKANALKVFIIMIYTFFALGVFILNKQVNYKYGLILSVGNMLGAFTASRFAVKWGTKFVRIFLLVIIFFAALEILGIIDIKSYVIELTPQILIPDYSI